jgi:hypothetical protein
VLYFVLWNYQGFPDRFLLLPFLAVLTGVAFAAPTFLARGARTRTAGRVASGVAVFVLIVVLRLDRIDASGTFTLQEQYRLGEHVGRMLADGHTVWAVGCTHLLAFNHVNNYLPYGFFFRGMDRYLRKVHGVRVFRPLRAGVLPEIILVSRGRARHSDHWLEQEYEAVRSRDFGHQGIHVYRLRDLDS